MTKNFLYRLLSSLFLAPIVIYFIYLGGNYFYFLLALIFLIGFYEVFNLNNKIVIFIISFLLLAFIFIIYQIINFKDGSYIIFYVVLLSWLSDIGGYVFGKFFGGKKIKFISPNKTYSGFVGSIIFTQPIIFFKDIFNLKLFNDIFFNSLFIFVCTAIVILGDLLFSYLKRKCDIKDFSNFLPGHGGLLDRIDGLILLTLFIFIILL
jgi:phosphatidate cytidylyltransferase